MANAAFTWVWNDMTALEVWCQYYSRYFDKLLVLCCGTKDEYIETLDRFKKQYNLDREHLEASDYDPQQSNQIVKDKQVELLKDHEWVLETNCDEIVAADPEWYGDLKGLMAICPKPWVACEAFDVVEWEEPPIDFSKPLLQQRKYWVKDENMNKVLLSRVPLRWNEGQHQIDEVSSEQSKNFKNTGLYLVHLRHFNLEDEQAHPRDFKHDRHGSNSYVLERRLDSRLEMPEWVRNLI